MKLLVTADWHIGKKLHNVDLREDMDMFFDWLLETIKRERIKYLLVAGDIFDNNNPSNDSSKIYYNFLVKLDQLDCKAIIIAGNHDSPPFIDAPKELLAAHHVTVIGLFPGIQNVEQIFIPICNEKKEMVAVVAAIPFLQDRFVRQVGEGEGAKEMEEKIKQGMKALFSKIGLALREKYPNIPRIGMAHLYAQGSTTNETEREIQVGNQDGIASDDLDQFDFLALGHIHTGQTVKTGKIQYASSPISLGFTENRYNHKVLVLDIVNDKIIPSEINIPKNRSLYQLKGTMDEILNQIQVLKKKYEDKKKYFLSMLEIAKVKFAMSWEFSLRDKVRFWRRRAIELKELKYACATMIQAHWRRKYATICYAWSVYRAQRANYNFVVACETIYNTKRKIILI
jgi:exonuclease SbcD